MRYILFLLVLISISFGQIQDSISRNNIDLTLKRLVEEDQAMRLDEDTDPGYLQEKDTDHREVIFNLLANNKITKPEHKYYAAIILQHTHPIFCNDELTSISRENYLLAHELAKSAAEEGYEPAKRLTAMTLDRYLWFSGKPQKYGTNYNYDDNGNKNLEPLDPNTTDEDRAKWNVEPLEVLLK